MASASTSRAGRSNSARAAQRRGVVPTLDSPCVRYTLYRRQLVQVVTAFRISNWDTPLWANPNRRAGRFNTIPGEIAQYWSLNPLAPWAEYLRFHNVREPDDVRDLYLRVWAARLLLPPDTATVDFGSAKAAGIEPDDLVADDWTACQDWAGRLSASAIVVPSAALPGTRNLVLFGPRARIAYDEEPVDPSIDTPTDPTAEVGLPVLELLPHVRWRGTPHEELLSWKAGRAWRHPLIPVSQWP